MLEESMIWKGIHLAQCGVTWSFLRAFLACAWNLYCNSFFGCHWFSSTRAWRAFAKIWKNFPELLKNLRGHLYTLFFALRVVYL